MRDSGAVLQSRLPLRSHLYRLQIVIFLSCLQLQLGTKSKSFLNFYNSPLYLRYWVAFFNLLNCVPLKIKICSNVLSFKTYLFSQFCGAGAEFILPESVTKFRVGSVFYFLTKNQMHFNSVSEPVPEILFKS